MKTKIVLLILALGACFTFACSKLDIPNPYPKPTEEEAPEKYTPYETVYVPVQNGYKAVVYVGTTRVATCYRSGNVLIPKTAATKAGESYQVINVFTGEDAPYTSENTLEMVVAYEDTKDGDHDYNDLVFQARLNIKNGDGGNKTEIEITPIALGASKTLSLGVVLSAADGTAVRDELITEDCNTFMFEGDCVEGRFINTTGNRKHYSPVKITLNSSSNKAVTGVSWYLISDTERLYAATTFQACLDDAEMPQGLVLMNLRDDIYYEEEDGVKYYCGNDFWQYPREGVHINQVYPGFEAAFLSRGDFSVLATPAADSPYYDAIAANENALTEDCLYTVYKQGGGDTPIGETVILWEDGPKWASFNVGANKPEETGYFFSWGNVEGHACPGEKCDYNFLKPYWDSTLGGELTDSFVSGDIRYDAARFNWGGQWRMPTRQEMYDLSQKTTCQWVSDYKGTGVAGSLLTSKTDPTKSLFFPACGLVDGTIHKNYGASGMSFIWSSDVYEVKPEHTEGRILRMGSSCTYSSYARVTGISVRPVCD